MPNDLQHGPERLAAYLRRRGIRDPRVLAAFAKVPRHVFAPPGAEELAYEDQVLFVKEGITLSQPLVVASMLEALELTGDEKALDIGAGTGYTTALLAELVRWVRGIELDADEARKANQRLAALGYGEDLVVAGDGWKGMPEEAPFDAVLVNAAAARWPAALVEQLAPGGRMVAPIHQDHQQKLQVLRKDSDGRRLWVRDLYEVRFVPLVEGSEDGAAT